MSNTVTASVADRINTKPEYLLRCAVWSHEEHWQMVERIIQFSKHLRKLTHNLTSSEDLTRNNVGCSMTNRS